MGSASRRSGRSRRPVRNWSTIRLQPSKPSPTWHGREETDFEERFMSKLDEMGKKVRRLQLRAAVAKMQLRPCRGSPGKWTEIEEVAQVTSSVFAELDGAKRALAARKKLR
ncbi:CCE_0567 family metalloprotein [Mesorhizobium caraganae]